MSGSVAGEKIKVSSSTHDWNHMAVMTRGPGFGKIPLVLDLDHDEELLYGVSLVGPLSRLSVR